MGGSADDAEAEFTSASLVYLTEEEIVSRYKRLYKKRANMGLAWYNKNNPVSCCANAGTRPSPKNRILFMNSPILMQIFILCQQEVQYEFTSVVLNDICEFMDGGICYTHMNFKARNVTTRSEELFFAELALTNDVFDTNSGYATTVCSIVDGNCVGMLLSFSLFVLLYIHCIAFLIRTLKRCTVFLVVFFLHVYL